jgi:hypothetical protein
VVEGIAEQIEHALAGWLIGVGPQLKAKGVGRPAGVLHHDFDVDEVGRWPVAGPAFVHAQKAELSAGVDRHGVAPLSRG